jgi:hypothetical protein
LKDPRSDPKLGPGVDKNGTKKTSRVIHKETNGDGSPHAEPYRNRVWGLDSLKKTQGGPGILRDRFFGGTIAFPVARKVGSDRVGDML